MCVAHIQGHGFNYYQWFKLTYSRTWRPNSAGRTRKSCSTLRTKYHTISPDKKWFFFICLKSTSHAGGLESVDSFLYLWPCSLLCFSFLKYFRESGLIDRVKQFVCFDFYLFLTYKSTAKATQVLLCNQLHKVFLLWYVILLLHMEQLDFRN